MKKIAACLSVVAIAAITLVSCSKKGDYTCTCTDSSGTSVGSGTYPNVKKSDAQKSCDLMSSTMNAAGAGITCKIN